MTNTNTASGAAAPEALRLADAIDPFERKSAPDHLTSKVAADELRRLYVENERLAALVEAQQHAPSAAVALSDDLRDRLVAISEAVADQDDRAAQAMLREILKVPLPSPTPQADSQPAPVVGTIAHVGTGKTTLARAIASALRAAPVEQPDTAYAELPAECDSPELCAVSRSCAGQFGTKRICASRGQAPAGAASVTDAMVLAALQVQYPAGYDTQLRHPANGPKTSARTEAEIDLARRMIAAALATHSAPAAQAPSVLEDAARYRHIRDVPHSEEVRSVLIHQQNAVMDRVIDKDRAAMAAKKGDAHE